MPRHRPDTRTQQRSFGALRSNHQYGICILPVALFFLGVQAQELPTSSLNQVISSVNLDVPLDPEELQMAKDLAVEDLRKGTLNQDVLAPLQTDAPAGVKQSSVKRGEPFEASSGLEHEQGGAEVTMGDAPLQFAVEDGFSAAAAHRPKNISSIAVKTDTVVAASEGSMDGAVGIVRTRLASEEQFNGRLQNLLAQSAMESRKKQERIDSLQAQLRKAMAQEQDLQGASLVKSKVEEKEIAQQHARADAAEKKLRVATHEVDVGRKTVTWLRDHVKSLLQRLGSVTHIGKTLQQDLVQETSNEAGLKQQLLAMQHGAEANRALNVEAKLHDVQNDKASEDSRLQALERQNELLQQRVRSLDKRDQILQRENGLLRGQFHSKEQQAEGSLEELDQVKDSLARAQSNNMDLENKYADSLKSLIISQAGGEHSSGGASLVGMDVVQLSPMPVVDVVQMSTLPAIATTSDDAGSEAPSSLLELRRDSRGLAAVIKESHSLTLPGGQ